MKDFFSIKNLKSASGFVTGFIVYDYFANDEINWIAAIIAGILAVAIMPIFNKTKKQ